MAGRPRMTPRDIPLTYALPLRLGPRYATPRYATSRLHGRYEWTGPRPALARPGAELNTLLRGPPAPCLPRGPASPPCQVGFLPNAAAGESSRTRVWSSSRPEAPAQAEVGQPALHAHVVGVMLPTLPAPQRSYAQRVLLLPSDDAEPASRRAVSRRRNSHLPASRIRPWLGPACLRTLSLSAATSPGFEQN